MPNTMETFVVEWNCVECDATGTLELSGSHTQLKDVLFMLHEQHTIENAACPTLTGQKKGVLKMAIWPEEECG